MESNKMKKKSIKNSTPLEFERTNTWTTSWTKIEKKMKNCEGNNNNKEKDEKEINKEKKKKRKKEKREKKTNRSKNISGSDFVVLRSLTHSRIRFECWSRHFSEIFKLDQ